MDFPMIPTSAETVTQDWIARVVADEFKTEPTNLLIKNWNITAGALRTDGFMSRMQRISVTARRKKMDANDTEGDPKSEQKFSLLAKLYPPGELHKKLVRKMRVFEREIHVLHDYTNLVLEQQVVEPKIRPSFAKLFFQEIGLEASCLVMEDLKEIGFRMNDKRLGMDLAHATLCVRAEAVHAATGFNAKQRMGIEQYLLRNAPLVVEVYDKNFGQIMDVQIFPGTIAFAKSQNRPDLVQRLEDYVKKVKSPFARFMAGVLRFGELAVMSHGDCWNNNYMFRYEKNEEGKDVPVEVKILDLQISRFSHITGDLASVLLANVPNKVRENCLNHLLLEYYVTFMSTVEKMETPWPNRAAYTFDAFLKDMESAWEMGFLISSWLLPMILSNDEELPNFDDIKDDRVEDLFEDHVDKMSRGDQAHKSSVDLFQRFTSVKLDPDANFAVTENPKHWNFKLNFKIQYIHPTGDSAASIILFTRKFSSSNP
ncbi:unnamed protein product [Notodromas monacha]|uniref:CHK kinase-like domain-containing protein n=1 Tax=Notodromas monacha TaxID=399045 RepID=A0A7R9BUR9_9CRUS|nr:unnamed protein product [Notodromas monacha]CAG0921085.1 unnamed protein product [Notodromas monacha]